MSRDEPPLEPRDANRYRITLDELERRSHIPADQQVSSQPVDRPPASTYEDETQRQLRLAGGA
jgi:hypothetical protein